MKASERRALLFTLETTRRHTLDRVTVLKRRIKADNTELEKLLKQLSNIEQSINYLETE